MYLKFWNKVWYWNNCYKFSLWYVSNDYLALSIGKDIKEEGISDIVKIHIHIENFYSEI